VIELPELQKRVYQNKVAKEFNVNDILKTSVIHTVNYQDEGTCFNLQIKDKMSKIRGIGNWNRKER